MFSYHSTDICMIVYFFSHMLQDVNSDGLNGRSDIHLDFWDNCRYRRDKKLFLHIAPEKKSHDVKSGEQSGQDSRFSSTSVPHLIHCCVKC